VAIIAAAAAITVATGGAAAGTLVAAVNCAAHGALVGAVTQGATGAITGAISGAVTHRLATGSWEGAAQAAANGAATGFLEGTISGAINGAINSPYCFVAGTLVLTVAGTVAIETIQAGDMVWAWDEETGEVAPKEVVETYVNETYELIHVFVDGEEIITTPAHPFYSPVKGWTNAVHLRAGDILVLVNGEYVIVEKVQHEILETPVTVYNFAVEDYHTYYVSDAGVLVHNVCSKQNISNATGQLHHPITRKIQRAARKTDNLGSVVKRSKWGTIQAKTLADHNGYQKWHRKLDDEIVRWLGDNKSADLDAFIAYMNKLYSTEDMTKKFGDVLFVK
jgi:hypothetical protein